MTSYLEINEFWKAVWDIDIRAVQIIQDEEEIYLYDREIGRRRNQYSITKSITSAAAGIAIQEKMFGLFDPVTQYIHEARGCTGLIKDLQIYHLLNMTQGFARPLLMGKERKSIKETDWVSYICNCPVIHKPGTRFEYNNAGPYLLGVIIQRISGQNLVDFLMPRLFEPLGIRRPQTEKCPLGYTFGAGGIEMNIKELGKFGLLYLRKGRWNGSQIISENWIRQSTEVKSPPEQRKKNESGYGFLFWINKDGSYMAKGKGGQFCIIIPDKQAVISINANAEKASDKIYDAVRETIISQL